MESDSEYHGLPLLGVNSSWPIMTLENICDGIFDCPHSTPKLSDDGYYMVRTQDIRKGFFDTQNAVKISKQSYIQRTKRAKPQYGDLLFSREGTYFGDAAEVPQKIELCLGQRMVLLRPCPEIINPTFLRIWINSKSFQIHLRSFRDGTVAERLNMSTIRKLPVPVPSLKIQSQVISLIIPLEKKDALNRQMNATLEDMAQALFKSWFVDFDPVIDNALAAGNPIPEAFAARAQTRRKALAHGTANRDIAKQFPTAFQFTEEMRWIPEGWEVKQIKEFGKIICGKTPSKKNEKYYGKDVPFIKIPDMHNNVWITEAIDSLSFEGAKSQQKKEIPPNSICVSCIATVGKVSITSAISHTNQQINSVVPNHSCSTYYLYFSFSGMGKKLIDLASGGSATLNLNTGDFSKIDIISPPTELLSGYHETIKKLFNKILSSEYQSKSLANLRDTLLPKLISGEIRIPEAEKLTEKALA